MRNGLKNLLIFSFGAAVGSVVTWKLLKTKYEQIANEEIESVKEVFSKHYNCDDEEPESEGKRELTDEEIHEAIYDKEKYTELLRQNGYFDKKEKGGANSMIYEEPYVIDEDRLGEDDYEVISLNYYSDDVITDDMDEVIEDTEDIIGTEWIDYFKEECQDLVCVRNEKLKCDYEIAADVRKYYGDVVRTEDDMDDEI